MLQLKLLLIHWEIPITILYICMDLRDWEKLHLMHAIANEVAQRNPDITPLYITAESFINDMIIHLRERKMAQFKMKYRENCSLLLMDDIQFLSRKEQMQEELISHIRISQKSRSSDCLYV